MAFKYDQSQLASWEDRGFAFLIDSWVAVQLSNISVMKILNYALTLEYQEIFKIYLYILLILYIYLVLMDGLLGQSLGKIVLGIKVVRTNGDPISLQDASIECFGEAFLLPIDIIIGLLIMPKDRVLFFNKNSDTKVVKI